MNLSLMNGHFSPEEAMDLITQMIQTKIKFHENKITISDHSEDIKMREKKIIQLQNTLLEVRIYLREHAGNINVQACINM